MKLSNKGWKEIFVDPGVYELTKSDSYSWEGLIDIGEFLDMLPDNCYFSADYPCDMNPKFTHKFLEKSWNNAIRYCGHKQYIVTVQSEFNNYWSFTQWFDKYNDLFIESGIMGLGNICRIFFLTEYIKMTLAYAFKNCKHPRIHIYGLGMRIIPYACKLAEKYDIKLSMDSTKWTRACNSELKWSEGYNCKKVNRQKFFDVYLETLRERGIKIE